MSDMAIQEKISLPLRRNPFTSWSLYAVCCLIGYLLYTWVLTPLLHVPIVQKESLTKQNLHRIQLALNDYRFKHDGAVPVDILELTRGGFLKQMPTNAFTGRPMRSVRFGQADTAGDFVYVTLLGKPCTVNGRDYPSRPCDFVIFALGHESTAGQHLCDGPFRGTYLASHPALHIILTLESNIGLICKGSLPYSGPPLQWASEELPDALLRAGYK